MSLICKAPANLKMGSYDFRLGNIKTCAQISGCNLSEENPSVFHFIHILDTFIVSMNTLLSKPKQIRRNNFRRWITTSHWFKHAHTDTLTHTQVNGETLGMTTTELGVLLKCNLVKLHSDHSVLGLW